MTSHRSTVRVVDVSSIKMHRPDLNAEESSRLSVLLLPGVDAETPCRTTGDLDH